MVFILIAYDKYYPSGDNIKGVFDNRELAYSASLKYINVWDNVEVIEKVIER